MSKAEANDRSSSSLMMRHSSSQPHHLGRGTAAAAGGGMTTTTTTKCRASSVVPVGGSLVDWRAGDDDGCEGDHVSNFYDLGSPAAAASSEQQQCGGSLWRGGDGGMGGGGGENGGMGPRTLGFSVHPGASGRGPVTSGDRQLLASQV